MVLAFSGELCPQRRKVACRRFVSTMEVSMRLSRFAKRFVFLLAVLSVAASAQEYRGRVQGTVLDSTKAAIPGASVSLLNVNTGVASTRQTDERGHYLFDLVMPGTYRVTVESLGFNKFVEENV